jgi:sulfite reductase (ferredoxin)
MVVSPIEFQLAACEREAFEAQLQLEKGDVAAAARLAYESMRHGAEALLRHRMIPFGDDLVERFRTELVETRLFWDRFVGGGLANYFFKAHENAGRQFNEDTAHQLIEEAQLFIEACHACYGKLRQEAVAWTT